MLKPLPELMPKFFKGCSVAVFVAAMSLVAPVMAQPPERTKAGTLACDISAGIGLIVTSKKSMTCMFMPEQPGPREVYTGSIGKFGLDLGATEGGEMVWTVLAPANKRFGALAGHYSGANPLVGGVDRSVALQPLPLREEANINAAAGVIELDLRPAR